VEQSLHLLYLYTIDVFPAWCPHPSRTIFAFKDLGLTHPIPIVGIQATSHDTVSGNQPLHLREEVDGVPSTYIHAGPVSPKLIKILAKLGADGTLSTMWMAVPCGCLPLTASRPTCTPTVRYLIQPTVSH